ncbi:MAG: methylenetetrahydrofolate--tRNA-(uracil(54)-C(5))-methyltransferase (FADH(2)-oxidizing) TrmFO [Desulfuromonadales bacterium]
MTDKPLVTIVGGGLAGCEAAWQAVAEGARVRLFEMKPQSFSPAHALPQLAELVCSNSLRGKGMNNAVGLLKEELRRCGSLFMEAADATEVPAGGALAVDREAFADFVTQRIEAHPDIESLRQEVVDIPSGDAVILASGPLTSEPLSRQIAALAGSDHLYFYDAIAPIVEADSIDMEIAWRGSRYGKGGDDYINCPMNRDQYLAFVEALREAEKVPARDFERLVHFEGCMPVEVLAERGEQTLAFGAMKPVGLTDPHTGAKPHAVVQLRQDNRHATLYNMVGFQTKLTWPEQRRIFRTIPGLENARFARLGSMHRNTFVNAPLCLERTLQVKGRPGLFLAGQITGVEGYVESAAIGFLSGIFAVRHLRGQPLPLPPEMTALGALLSHLADSDAKGFQPMNVNYGLFPPLENRKRKRAERRLAMAERGLEAIAPWRESLMEGRAQ